MRNACGRHRFAAPASRYTPRMTAKTLAVLIVSSLLLAGCGNKGPLVLPPAPVGEDAPPFDAPPPMPDSDAPHAEAEAEVDAGGDSDADTDASAEIEPGTDADTDTSDPDPAASAVR